LEAKIKFIKSLKSALAALT